MNLHRSFATSLFAAIAILFIGGSASAQHFEFGVQGGKGGGGYRVVCPPHTFMVGLRGRAGVVIDTVQLLCAGFQELPPPPFRKDWKRDPNAFPVGNFIGTSPGGGGLERVCTGDRFVRGIVFNTAFFQNKHLVAFIQMTCDHGRFAGFDELNFGFNFPRGSIQRQFCPGGMWAVGLKGRFGDFVDATALLCAKMPPF